MRFKNKCFTTKYKLYFKYAVLAYMTYLEKKINFMLYIEGKLRNRTMNNKQSIQHIRISTAYVPTLLFIKQLIIIH